MVKVVTKLYAKWCTYYVRPAARIDMAHTPYQKRMTKFVAAGVLYAVAFPLGIKYFSAPAHYYLLYVSTLVVLFCLAAGLDAAYDSLREKLDSQSGR